MTEPWIFGVTSKKNDYSLASVVVTGGHKTKSDRVGGLRSCRHRV